MDIVAIGIGLAKDSLCRALQQHDGIVFVIGHLLCSDVTTQEVGGLQTVLRHLISRIEVVDQVRACDGIAVLIGQLVNARQAVLSQIGFDGVIGRSKTSIVSIACQQIHQSGTLYDSSEFTE